MINKYVLGLLSYICIANTGVADTINSPIKVDDLMVREFASRPNVKQFAGSELPFASSSNYIVFGRSSQTNACSEPGEMPSVPNPLPENMVFGTIDVLFDPTSCERLVKVGFIETILFDALISKRVAQGVIESVATYKASPPNQPNASQHRSLSHRSEAPLTASVVNNGGSNSASSSSSYTATDGVGIYYEYNDAGAPPFTLVNGAYSIPVAWAQANLQFDSTACLGGAITSRFRTFWQVATGWQPNPAVPATGRLDVSCNYFCVNGFCDVTDFDFTSKTVAGFTNPGIEGFLSNGLSGGFPSCFGTVNLNFNPAGIRTTKAGGASDISASSIAGPMAGCVAWQRNFRIIYTGTSYAFARSTPSPTNPTGGLPNLP